MSDYTKLDMFVKRMEKFGIDVQLAGNYPWIYIDKINGKRVTEKFHADHGFTIGFLPIRVEQEFAFTDIGEIFKIIRKYSVPERKVIFEKYVPDYNILTE